MRRFDWSACQKPTAILAVLIGRDALLHHTFTHDMTHVLKIHIISYGGSLVTCAQGPGKDDLVEDLGRHDARVCAVHWANVERARFLIFRLPLVQRWTLRWALGCEKFLPRLALL